jgi:hypothetical protein
MVGGDDYRALGRHIAESANLGTECKHQERGQECSQGSVGQVVEHGDNLVVIDDYDTIWG